MQTYDETGIIILLFIVLMLIMMLISSARQNTEEGTYKSQVQCEHDWIYDGENGSHSGAFYYCTKCGKNKYIPYRELMAMSEEEYKFWMTRPVSEKEKSNQCKLKNKK
jgi:hypothetical protein